MKIIAKGRGQGKTTELIKISAEKQIPIVCGISSKDYIKDRAKEMKLKIPEPMTLRELRSTRQYRDTEILIDNAEFVLSSLLQNKIDVITVNIEDKQENKKINYFEDKVKKLKLEADKITKQLDNCKDSNEYIGRIKALEKVLELIKEYDWHNEYSKYRTGEDNHVEVSTWEQNSNGEIKNHKRYIVSKSYDNDNMNLIEQELNDTGIVTRINDDMFRPFEDIMKDICKMCLPY